MVAGRYSLEREVGRGGMGAVWLGRDEVLGRPVAMKRIGMAPGTTTPDLQRAEREARLAARLNHPHVVAVFDLVNDDGGAPEDQWLVMEYVEGPTLAQLVQERGPLPVDEAARLIGQAADGLAAAHAAGIVHRDVKPSNIMVTRDGQVKLTDFGIARGDADASLTRTGLVTGSPAYLAPEVASGRTATAASDVWSLGATLFHALSGRPPYEVGDNLMGALYRIVHEEPPRLPDAGWLGPLLEATMAREPADRWSMAQVRDALLAGRAAAPAALRPAAPPAAGRVEEPTTAVLRAPGATASGTSPSDRRTRTVVTVLLGVAVVVALTVASFLLGTREDDDEPSAGATASSGTTAPASSPPPSRRTTPVAQDRPTAAGMRRFVQDYLETAAADPRAAFAMLTPAFQGDSGGFDGYESFWGRVDGVSEVEVLAADPASLTVTYSYVRQVSGTSVQDTTTVRLTYADGVYLIDGEPGG